MTRVLWVGLVLFPVGCTARAGDPDDRAAAWVQGIGGKVVRDATRPGNPVIGVDLGGNKQVTNDGLKELAGLKDVRRISLYFDGQVADAGVAHLSGLTTLEELTLGNTGVGDAGLAGLAALRRLRKLHLAGAVRLTDAAAETVGGFTALEDLSLPSTVTARGLARLVGLKKLRVFYLGGGTPADPGVRRIAENMPDLEALELGTYGPGGNGITDASVPALAGLKRLRKAGLVGSRLTDGGLAELRAALPDCVITTTSPTPPAPPPRAKTLDRRPGPAD